MAWVEKTKTGYRLCDRIKIDGKIKRVTVPLEKDTAQARRKATEALLEKARQNSTPSCEKSLNSLVELYLKKKNCKETSRDTDRHRLKKALEVLNGIPIDAKAINRAFMESDKKPRTLNAYIEVLRAMLRWCYRYGYIEEDIAPQIYKLADNDPRVPADQKYLEPGELKNVLSQMSGMYLYVCRFLVLTGCRIGEAAALTWDDISDGYVHITKTESKYGVTTPKTETSTRDIFIQDELADLLKEYKEWRLLYMMSLGIRTERLFFTQSGERVLSKLLGRYLSHIECPKHLHPHIFRHTHTALLAEQGMSLEAIGRRLGHSNSQITKEVYFHVTEKIKKRDEEAIRKVRIL